MNLALKEQWRALRSACPSLTVSGAGNVWRASWSPNATRYEEIEAFTEADLIARMEVILDGELQRLAAQQKPYFDQVMEATNRARQTLHTTVQEMTKPTSKKNTEPKKQENPYRRKFG